MSTMFCSRNVIMVYSFWLIVIQVLVNISTAIESSHHSHHHHSLINESHHKFIINSGPVFGPWPVNLRKWTQNNGTESLFERKRRHRKHSSSSLPSSSSSSSEFLKNENNQKIIEFLSNQIKIHCRTEWAIELPFDVYMLDTCARCYHYMPPSAFKPNSKFNYEPFGKLHHRNRTVFSNDTIQLSKTFSSMALVFKWQQCCKDAMFCCINFHKNYPPPSSTSSITNSTTTITNSSTIAAIIQPNNDSLPRATSSKTTTTNITEETLCPPTWDGWLCWDEYARPDEMVERSCPKHIYWHQLVPPCRGYATKFCTPTGKWYINNENREWSNYSLCARDDIYSRRVQYSLVTNIISMCALIPALFIFTHYKQLSSMSRIRLHKHLFTSLLFHALISALLKWHLLKSFNKGQAVILNEKSPVSDHQTGRSVLSFCLVLSVMLRYFRSTNYLWMFNEALYLHQLIKRAFTQPSLRPLIILAYSLPFITTASYIVARLSFLATDTDPMANMVKQTIIDPSVEPTWESNSFTSSFSSPSSLSSPDHESSPFNNSVQGNSLANQYQQFVESEIRLALSSFIRTPSFQKNLKQVLFEKISLSSGDSGKVPLLFKSFLIYQDNPKVPSPAERFISNEPSENDKDDSIGFNYFESSTSTPANDDIMLMDEVSMSITSNIELYDDSSSVGSGEDQCWLTPSNENWHEYIINLPNLAILIINCFFLVWLLRVLCLKAAATSSMISSSPSKRSKSSGSAFLKFRRGKSKKNVSDKKPKSSSTPFNDKKKEEEVDDGQLGEEDTNNNNNGANHHPNHHNEMDNEEETIEDDERVQLKLSKSNGSMRSTSIRASHLQMQHRNYSALFSRQSIFVSLRAAVLLLPLYGLHYLVIVYRPKIENCWFSEIYHYLSLSLDGLQGLAVSILFCFANSEVRNLLTRSLRRVGTRQRSTTIYLTEVATNRD